MRGFTVIAAVLLLPTAQASADLIVNGGFETPRVSDPQQFLTIMPGSEPADFGWNVSSGNVDVVIRGSIYASTAYEGLQFLDLDGTTAGAISQAFATDPGKIYRLSFAYANNPLLGATIPARAIVRVFDSGSGSDLMSSLEIVHGSSTVANPDWTPSELITFVASGFNTTLSFASLNPASSRGGIFLDAVSVTAVPEPSTLLSAALGLAGLAGYTGWKRRQGRTAS